MSSNPAIDTKAKKEKRRPSFRYNHSTSSPSKPRIYRLIIFSSDEGFVTFFIGKEEKKFIVHKAFVCHYSPPLDAAFKGNHIEGQTQTYRLEDVDAPVFSLFIQWVYSQSLDVAPEKCLDNAANTSQLAALWVLADRLIIPRLQNLVIDILNEVAHSRKQTPLWDIPYIYEKTSESSVLRRWIIDRCVRRLTKAGFLEGQESFTRQSFVDVTLALCDTAIIPAFGPRNMADFHVPEE